MASHKNQHFVPQSYTKAWCDPNTPDGQTPYVWRFEKDGSRVKKKSPENIFFEKDMYTIKEEEGGRNLTLEHRLSELESRFAVIRDKLASRKPIDQHERSVLCTFAAASHARTTARRSHLANEWGKVLAMGEKMKEVAKSFTDEQRRQAKLRAEIDAAINGGNITYTEEEVKLLVEEPLQQLMSAEIGTMAPLLCAMDITILEAKDSNTFITSDNPCVWFDSQAYKRPPAFRAPALMHESTEIRLPLSPYLMLVFMRDFGKMADRLIPIKDELIDDMNRITRFSSYEYFISNSNKKKDIWFQVIREPDDSWNNTHVKNSKTKLT
jgi:hypothetical protein